jgi:uncharacterized protein (DUF488 family)
MLRIFTIGHSTRSAEEFLSLLNENKIETVADIRSFPASRKFPHFGRENLEEILGSHNIGYVWCKDLGGFRKGAPGKESVNKALSSPGFRHYADHMETEVFQQAVSHLLNLAAKSRTTVMCAERLFWKCHRRLLSDYLVSLDVEVVHILDPGKNIEHTLAKEAVKTKEGVIYP